jgi:hypothetical protein
MQKNNWYQEKEENNYWYQEEEKKGHWYRSKVKGPLMIDTSINERRAIGTRSKSTVECSKRRSIGCSSKRITSYIGTGARVHGLLVPVARGDKHL